MSKNETINLLNTILKGLKALDETEYQKLVEGKGRIKFIGLGSPNTDNTRKEGKNKRITLSEDGLLKLAANLQECKTRDDAYIQLHEANRKLSKESLTRLSQILGIYVSKADKSGLIEEKIIESVVGAKLRSEAIRGLNLKGNIRDE